MKTTNKRLSAVAMLCLFAGFIVSCAPKSEQVFITSADTWLCAFSDSQTAFGGQTSYEYSSTGSVAITTPKSNVVGVESAVNQYCNELKQEFQSKSQTDNDKLLISFKSYSASKEITGVEIVSKQVLQEVATEKTKLFTFDSNGVFMPGDILTRSVKIHAQDAVLANEKYINAVDKDKLKSYLDFQLMLTDAGIDVLYPAGSLADAQTGDIRVSVPYTAVRFALPDSIKENVAEQSRVVDISKKLVAITLDDGPHDVYTNQILDTLEKNGAVATFFDVGSRMESGAKIMKRAKALGCEMGTHSYSHANLKKADVNKIRDEITKTDAIYESILGEKPVVMRPPYGSVGKDLKNTSPQFLVGWSVDTLDWKSRDSKKIVEYIKSYGNLDGSVLLMHAIYKSSADSIDQIVPWLEENGYQLVTVSELMKYRYESEFQTGKYYAKDDFVYKGN